jgi:hypothetical protein
MKGIESNEGTVLYESTCYKNNYFLNDNRVLYTFINSLNIEDKDIIKYIQTGDVGIPKSSGFLEHETIYKVKGGS